MARDFRERARELHAGRTAADNDEGEEPPGGLRIGFLFGGLERQQDPSPDLQRVVQGLEPRGARRPFRMPEVRVGSARRHNQVVVRNGGFCRLPRMTIRRAATSMPRTSASSTFTFDWWRSTHRMGDAMSPGDSEAVAT